MLRQGALELAGNGVRKKGSRKFDQRGTMRFNAETIEILKSEENSHARRISHLSFHTSGMDYTTDPNTFHALTSPYQAIHNSSCPLLMAYCPSAFPSNRSRMMIL